MEATSEALAQLILQRARMLSEIESTTRMNNLEPAETFVIARERFENKGMSKKLIVFAAMGLAFTLGGGISYFYG
jgi:hypothetical protein